MDFQMNLTPAFFVSALAEYWYVFVILIFLVFLKSPFFKGFIGEVIINITTSLFLDKKKYHLIKNVTLPTDDGTTQIDHIIVSQYGIFVVETKNMKGMDIWQSRQKNVDPDHFQTQNPIPKPFASKLQTYQNT
jgi:restriction system protein